MLLRKIALPLVVLTSSFIVACSSSDSSTATNEFSSLPEVTGPVVGASASSLGIIGSLLASTGTKISAPGTFASGTSLQMCDNVNLLKEILREASNPDKILCYMGKMKAANVLPASMVLADGEFHYVKLINLQSQDKPSARSAEISEPLVKFKIVKTGSAITSFVMYSCFAGSNASPVQSEYISQTFSGTQATVITKNTGSEGTESYGSSLTATGEFTTAWQSKNISGFRYYSNSSPSNSNATSIDMDQYSNTIEMGIAMKGTYGTDTFLNKFFTVAQLLNASSLSTFAIGHGSSKYSMSVSGGGTFSDTGTKSWNGDTKAIVTPASNGDFYNAADAGTVPADPTVTPVTFTGDEAWDCTAPSGQSFVSADFNSGGSAIQTGMAACDDKFLSGGDWLQCPYY